MTIAEAAGPAADRWLAGSDPEPALVVAGIPVQAGSPPGSAVGETPRLLRAGLARFSTFDEEQLVDLDRLPVADLGDWEVDPHDPLASVTAQAAGLAPGPVYALLGGGPAVADALLGGLQGWGRAGLIAFDGGAAGSPKAGTERHSARIARVGLRSFAGSAARYDRDEAGGVLVFSMQIVEDWGVEDAVNAALDDLARESDWILMVVDPSVLDAAFAPACRMAGPGGMTPRQLAAAARICGRHPGARAALFCGVDLATDPGDRTVAALGAVFLAFAAGVAQRREGPP